MNIMKEFNEKYFADFKGCLDDFLGINSNREYLYKAVRLLKETKENNSTIYLVGNGGSSAIALIDVEMTAGSDIPLSFYENRVGGANTGDNYEISFDFNDTLGNRVMGTSIQARVDDTAASAGDVNTSLVLSKVFKVSSNGRSIFTDAALTAAPTAQLEVRGNVAATTSFLVKSGGNTNAFNPIWIQNLSGNTN